MILYFDTSALVKFFHIEDGTHVVSDLIENSENKVHISELAKIEFYCALYRRFRNGDIDKGDLHQALDGFEIQIDTFHVERFGSAVIQEAEKLLKKFGARYGLRTLDALHVATFSLISEDQWYFVSADKQLNEVVSALGYEVINPIHV